MHNPLDFSQQLIREKALHRYIIAFEHGDLDIMDEILQQAMTDSLLYASKKCMRRCDRIRGGKVEDRRKTLYVKPF